jgi:hypothetical protein
MSDQFDSLDKQTQLIILSLLDTEEKATKMSNEVREQIECQTLALTQIISRLSTINENEHRKTREMIMKTSYDEKFLRNGDVVAEVEIFAVSDLQELKHRSSIQMLIREALAYPAMNYRYEDVVDAYPNTFDWAFSDPTVEQLPWSNLSKWLKEGDGVYWINGKAGSGKTTLMKHIFDDSRTRKYLVNWSGDEPQCVATFFFWNSGSREQRSQAGLLRSILFQVLEACPELAPILMPQTWATKYSKCLKGEDNIDLSTESWHLRTLKAAFKSFIEQKEIPLKTCLLIDGLDEFDGDHEEIASLFKGIASSKSVKVCLSSRPLVIFREAFSSCQSLRLQDLTFSDIRLFVSERFSQNESFQRLADREPEYSSTFIKETVEKADGVFIWVQIVVRSLLNGIRNRDSVHELLIRLRELPKEIEPLYQHLLSRIEPIYLPWASRAVQLLRLYHRLSDNHHIEYLNVRRFYFAMSTNSKFSEIETLSSDLLAKRCEDIEVQLAARCAGLVEISRHSNREDASIKWFHRTARDFIEQNSFGLNLLGKPLDPELNPGVLMMKAHIIDLMLQIRHSPKGARHLIQPLVNSCLIYAEDIDSLTETNPAQVDLLDRMDKFLATNCSGREHWMVPFVPRSSVQALPVLQVTFLHIAVARNLTSYVGAKVPFETPRRYNSLALSLLRFKVPSDEIADLKPDSHDSRMIHFLEELGATIKPGETRDIEKKKKGYWSLSWSLW